MNTSAPISEAEIKNFVTAWYQALDVHFSIEQVYTMLADRDLGMKFPDGIIRDYASFKKWYNRVITLFFDESHNVQDETFKAEIHGAEAVVNLVVSWQASWWEPPAARSKRVSLDSTQRWTVRRSSKNSYGLEIVTYDATIEPFKYAPGFPRLPVQKTLLVGSHSLAAKYMQVPYTLDTRGTNYELPIFTAAAPTSLAGKRVLIISADCPELPEIDVPIEYLQTRGADVRLAGQDWIFKYRNPAGYIVIGQWLADNICVKADLRLSDVRVTNYDALFIPGGAWNPDMLRNDEVALRIVREARAQGVLIVSLCHGPQVLISAANNAPGGPVVFPPGTHITGVQSIRVDLKNAGFIVHDDDPTVYDPASRLLTARDPNDLGPLCEKLERLLCSGVSS